MAITQSSAPVTPGSGETISTVNVANGVATDLRQVMCIGGPNTTDGVIIAAIASALPASGALGLVVREVAQGQATMANSRPVVIASDQSAVPVSGTVTANAGTGTFAISAASLPLPTGASTAAKQPALGTAGTASADVITIQGIASMTAVKVDGSAVTQPVSGTVTSNIGTTNGLALDATVANVQSGAGATSSPAKICIIGGKTNDVTPSYQPIPLTVSGAAVKVDGSAVTQPVSGTVTANAGTGTFAISASALPLPSGASTAAKQPALGTAGSASADVITVQGVASMTPLKVDNSANTQPVKPGAPTTSGYSSAAITFSASGDNTIVAGVTSQTIRIFRIFFVNSDATTASNITLKDSTPTSLSGAFRLASGGSFAADGEGDPLFVSASGKGIIINSSGAVQISGTVWYTQS